MNLHEGHRQRLKQRFLAGGLSGFEDHNILELLLFYSVPRADTNELGHKLIKKFGSLSAVFEASIEELCDVEGIGVHSAVLIKLIPELCNAYNVDKTKNVIIEDAYLSSVFYHELGHAVDYIFGNQVFLSSSSEFKNIYEEEKNIKLINFIDLFI